MMNASYRIERETASAISPASFLGYQNGAQGPVFATPTTRQTDLDRISWPIWTNTLPGENRPSRIEGGTRTQGNYKSGTAAEPLISYITVVRNNATTLERTIESVRQQTYRNVEHIVLDGASTDGTLDIIRRHANRLDYFASEPDHGLYDALNKAIPLARGQLICILNSDDWLEPNAAEVAARHMAGENTNRVLFTAAKVLDGEIVHDWPPAFVHPGSYFTCANDCHNGIYATRFAYERSGPYDSSYKIAADFKWIMACLDAGAIFMYTKEPTVNYSLGGTSSDFLKHSQECMRVVQERFPFLAPNEVRGLYHSFFVFSSTTTPYESDRPPNLTLFLRELFSRHAAATDFSMALGWALVATMDHPADRRQASQLTKSWSARQFVKQLLKHHPSLYRFTHHLYLRLFKS